MDIIDRASEREAEILEDALMKQQRKMANGISNQFCEDCGAPIPVARQKAIQGVKLCVHCQEYLERGYP